MIAACFLLSVDGVETGAFRSFSGMPAQPENRSKISRGKTLGALGLITNFWTLLDIVFV